MVYPVNDYFDYPSKQPFRNNDIRSFFDALLRDEASWDVLYSGLDAALDAALEWITYEEAQTT